MLWPLPGMCALNTEMGLLTEFYSNFEDLFARLLAVVVFLMAFLPPAKLYRGCFGRCCCVLFDTEF